MKIPTKISDSMFSDEIRQKIARAKENIPDGISHQQLKLDAYNSLNGSLGYIDCPECRNKGFIAVINDDGQEVMRECNCMRTRRLYHNLEHSGLQGVHERYKLENYTTAEQWQKDILIKATRYIKDIKSGNKYWMYAGGQRGSGKSHICTAVSCRLIAYGKRVLFKMWQDVVSEYRAKTYKDDERRNFTDEIFGCDVLYIDDFLKCRSRNDIDYNYDLAFQVLNARYNARKITIISSELTIKELSKEDSSLSGRIVEMANKGEYVLSIEKSSDKDMRMKRS